MCLPYEQHREIHEGSGGGRYNNRFDELIQEHGGYDDITPRELNEIRDQLIREFNLPGF